MIPSPYQKAVFDFVQTGAGSAIVGAVAGSGKTTTIVQAVKLIPKDQSVLMLAFNKSIAEELNVRINLPNVEVKTFHSLGFAAYRSVHGAKVKMDNNKLFRLIDDLVNNSDLTPIEKAGLGYVSKIVKLGKSMGIGTSILENTEENWWNLIEHHDVGGRDEGVDLGAILPICQEILFRSNNMKYLIDFDDMIYSPVQQNLRFKKYDWVFVDEAQDCSATQRWILNALMKPSSRLIAVGDACQAIYGFRGADSSSLQMIGSEFNAVTLPLSISYRCPKAVVTEAQKYVSHIESSETAPEGSVSRLDKVSTEVFSPSDAILCRNVAPLVKFAYGLISRGTPVNMMGRDIGKGLITLVKNMKAKDIVTLDEKLTEWSDNEINRLAGKQGNESKIESITDKVDCIKIFISQATPGMTVQDLMKKIEAFFSDEPNGNVTLSTCHKSKGLEFGKVFILDEHRFFPKWAKLPWMIEQEKNLKYVAITRAKQDLVYISSGTWKD